MKKAKKISALILTVIMLAGIIPQAYADTLNVTVYPNNYVMCNETFEGAQTHSDLVQLSGITQLNNGEVKLYDSGKVTADLTAGNLGINEGVVDISFGFMPQMEGSGSGTAVQTFFFGSDINEGISVTASWVRGSTNTMTDGKFMADSTELVKFNGGTGSFRYLASNTSQGYVTYDINAKINLNTKKLTLTIDETVIKPDTEDMVSTVYENDFNYNFDSVGYFSSGLSTATGLISYVDFVKIKLDGSGSFNNIISEGESGIVERTLYNETFENSSNTDSHTSVSGIVFSDNGYKRLKAGWSGSIDASFNEINSGTAELTYGMSSNWSGANILTQMNVMHIGPDSSNGLDIGMYQRFVPNNIYITWYLGNSTSATVLVPETATRLSATSAIPKVNRYNVTVDFDFDLQKAYVSIFMDASAIDGSDVSGYVLQDYEIEYSDSISCLKVYNTERGGNSAEGILSVIYPIKLTNTSEDSALGASIGTVTEKPYLYQEGFSNEGNPADDSSVSFDDNATNTYKIAAAPWNGIQMSGGSCRMRTIEGTVWGDLTSKGREIIGGKAVFSIDMRTSFRGITQLPTEPEAVSDVISIGANESDNIKLAFYYESSKADLGNCGPAVNCGIYVGEDNTGDLICSFNDGEWYTIRVEMDMDSNLYDVYVIDSEGNETGSVSGLTYNYDSLGYWMVVNHFVAGTYTWSESKQQNVGRVSGDAGCDTLIDNVCIGINEHDGAVLESVILYDADGNEIYLDGSNQNVSNDVDRIILTFDTPMSGKDIVNNIVIDDAEYTINLDGNVFEIVFDKMLKSNTSYILDISPELLIVTGEKWGINESYMFTTFSGNVKSAPVKIFDGDTEIVSINEWNSSDAPLIKATVYNPSGNDMEIGFFTAFYKNGELIGVDYTTYEADAIYDTCNFAFPASKVEGADKVAVYTLNSFTGMVPLNAGKIIN